MEATGTAAAASSVRWQLCYDVTAKTWWMVSGGARPGGVSARETDFGVGRRIWRQKRGFAPRKRGIRAGTEVVCSRSLGSCPPLLALALLWVSPWLTPSSQKRFLGEPREQPPPAGLPGTRWCLSIARTRPGPILGTVPRGQDLAATRQHALRLEAQVWPWPWADLGQETNPSAASNPRGVVSGPHGAAKASAKASAAAPERPSPGCGYYPDAEGFFWEADGLSWFLPCGITGKHRGSAASCAGFSGTGRPRGPAAFPIPTRASHPGGAGGEAAERCRSREPGPDPALPHRGRLQLPGQEVGLVSKGRRWRASSCRPPPDPLREHGAPSPTRPRALPARWRTEPGLQSEKSGAFEAAPAARSPALPPAAAAGVGEPGRAGTPGWR